MSEPLSFKYRAFLSYTHADASWTNWLRKALEGFRIDKDLVGRETATGRIPKNLRPIFRDRDDFTAGHSLTQQTIEALDASAALVVVCSPASVQSRYVNEEIRLFKSRHPERPVIPVIVAGRPGGGNDECFAPPLKFKVSSQGQITTDAEEVLGADVREEGDGKHRALAKVVAAILALTTDDVIRRAEQARRRSARIRNGIVGALAILAVSATASAAYAWHLLKSNEAFLTATLQRATEIVNTAVAQAEKYNVPRTATLELLQRAEGLFDDMARLGRPTPQLQRQKAWMLIAFARNYAILGDTTKQRQSADEAHRIMARLADGNPENLKLLRDLSVAHDERGDVLVTQGNVPAALKAYNDALDIRTKLVDVDPKNTLWQRDLVVSHGRIGDVLRAQGYLSDALAAYQHCLAITVLLTKADPRNMEWQRDLTVSHDKIADVLVAQGNPGAALAEYRSSLTIRERFVQTKAAAAGWQRDLSNSHETIGDVLLEQREYSAARVAYQRSLTIRNGLANADPSNTGWQRDLSVAHNKIGDVLRRQGHLASALDSYKTGLAIRERLAKADPANTVWLRDLSISHYKLADVYLAQGKLPAALEKSKARLTVAQRLARTDPANTDWERDVALSYLQVGILYAELENWSEARENLLYGRKIMIRLAKLSPDNAEWQKNVRIFDLRIAGLTRN